MLALLQMIDQPFSLREAIAIGMRLVNGLFAAWLAYRFVRRVPWPRPFRLRFVLLHVVAAPSFGALWLLLTTITTVLVTGRPFLPTLRDIPTEFLFIGSIVYTILAGIVYADEATLRAWRAEAAAAQTQLAVLRAQIQPHFLFNALHTVVQLIPVHPDRAVEAAELVAAMLRTTIDEQRDLVQLADEWAFVSRYLELESIRFGERLRVHADIEDELLGELVPSFALQTLVENAVQHGAAPRIAPTDIHITARGTRHDVTLSVRNTGDTDAASPAGTGTGLQRLQERLRVLYGDAARLTHGRGEEGGYEAVLVLPRRAEA